MVQDRDDGDITYTRETIKTAAVDDLVFLNAWGFTATECCRCGLSIIHTNGRLLQCARCKLAHYCSGVCLQADFGQHLPVCIKVVEAHTAAALAAVDGAAAVVVLSPATGAPPSLSPGKPKNATKKKEKKTKGKDKAAPVGATATGGSDSLATTMPTAAVEDDDDHEGTETNASETEKTMTEHAVVPDKTNSYASSSLLDNDDDDHNNDDNDSVNNDNNDNNNIDCEEAQTQLRNVVGKLPSMALSSSPNKNAVPKRSVGKLPPVVVQNDASEKQWMDVGKLPDSYLEKFDQKSPPPSHTSPKTTPRQWRGGGGGGGAAPGNLPSMASLSPNNNAAPQRLVDVGQLPPVALPNNDAPEKQLMDVGKLPDSSLAKFDQKSSPLPSHHPTSPKSKTPRQWRGSGGAAPGNHHDGLPGRDVGEPNGGHEDDGGRLDGRAGHDTEGDADGNHGMNDGGLKEAPDDKNAPSNRPNAIKSNVDKPGDNNRSPKHGMQKSSMANHGDPARMNGSSNTQKKHGPNDSAVVTTADAITGPAGNHHDPLGDGILDNARSLQQKNIGKLAGDQHLQRSPPTTPKRHVGKLPDGAMAAFDHGQSPMSRPVRLAAKCGSGNAEHNNGYQARGWSTCTGDEIGVCGEQALDFDDDAETHDCCGEESALDGADGNARSVGKLPSHQSPTAGGDHPHATAGRKFPKPGEEDGGDHSHVTAARKFTKHSEEDGGDRSNITAGRKFTKPGEEEGSNNDPALCDDIVDTVKLSQNNIGKLADNRSPHHFPTTAKRQVGKLPNGAIAALDHGQSPKSRPARLAAKCGSSSDQDGDQARGTAHRCQPRTTCTGDNNKDCGEHALEFDDDAETHDGRDESALDGADGNTRTVGKLPSNQRPAGGDHPRVTAVGRKFTKPGEEEGSNKDRSVPPHRPTQTVEHGVACDKPINHEASVRGYGNNQDSKDNYGAEVGRDGAVDDKIALSMDTRDDPRSPSKGRLDLSSDSSTKSPKTLASVGKLPANMVSAFHNDAGRAPCSYKTSHDGDSSTARIGAAKGGTTSGDSRDGGRNILGAADHDDDDELVGTDRPGSNVEDHSERNNFGTLSKLDSEDEDQCQSPSRRAVGKLQPFDLSPMSPTRVPFSPGRLPMNVTATFESNNNGMTRQAGSSWNRDPAGGCSPLRERAEAHRAMRSPSDPEQSRAARYMTSPNRLSNDALETFEHNEKERLGASPLADVDQLPADAIECFEHPASSPPRPLRPAGKLPSFAMRVFAPRSASQDKLPPAFSRLKVMPAAAQQQTRKWKTYRPRAEQSSPSSSAVPGPSAPR